MSKSRKTPFSIQEGLKVGAAGKSVEDLHAYLNTFGYLSQEETEPAFASMRDLNLPLVGSNGFDDNTTTALKTFQRFYGLHETGETDAATVALMSQPRCGSPDQPSVVFKASSSFAEFVAQGNRWPKPNVTFGFTNYTGDLPQVSIRQTIRQAFTNWSNVSALTFTEVPAANADIVIGFFTGNHGDGSNFDGPGNILAHGFYPPPNGGAIAGDLHFDDAETWTTNLPPTGIDLATVSLHEIGHTLGLAHSTITSSVMYAFYGGPRRSLQPDDINGIVSIYGGFATKSTLSDTSIASPAFAEYGNRGFIAWSGTDSAHHLNVMTTDNMRVWHDKVTLGDTSLSGPALAVYNQRLYIAWRGVGNNQLNIMSSADGINWGHKVTLGDTTFNRPALAVYNGKLVLGWTGTDNSRKLNIIHSTDGVTWGNKITLGDTSIDGPALASIGNDLLIAWAGTDSANRLNVMRFNGASWFNKVTLNETSFASPAMVNLGGWLRLGWTGTDAARRLNVLRSTDAVAWTSKNTFGDNSFTGPSLGTFGGSRVIAWTGTDTAHSLNAMTI